MNNRRQFLRQLGLASTSGVLAERLLLPQVESLIDSANLKYKDQENTQIALEEDYWEAIREAYNVTDELINLNNGGVSPHPAVVEEAMIRYHKFSNQIPSFNMWRKLDKDREPLRENLALLAGCDQEEIAIQRNASEAIETVIFGLALEKGDEVILSKQAYPNMMNAWKQRERRDGITLVWLDFELPTEDEDFIVETYRKAITKNTKLVHITHIINWMGQIMPAKKIGQMAHSHGIEVLVDGAHSFAHIDYSLSDLGCDYFGTSLHKWLGAPFGTGMLFVKKEKIEKIYPLLAAPLHQSKDIRKFENLGTRSFAIEQAIMQAIQFHNKIGTERKQHRLFELMSYWTKAVKQIPSVSIGTSADPSFACGIALLQVNNMKPVDVSGKLYRDYNIHSVAIDYHNIQGVRLTPNVYTLKTELNRLIEAVQEITNA